eukprot:m.89221 g.89221  ORF g.89221 m.89221 type:complete len:257 (-) comp26276_c0_seq1:237-1007(-)
MAWFGEPITTISPEACALSLRVRCRLDHPIWGQNKGAHAAGATFIEHLTRLEMICRKIVNQIASSPGSKQLKTLKLQAEECNQEISAAYDDLYCFDESIVSYMDRVKLSAMFPKTRALLNDPPLKFEIKKVAMDTYFEHFAMLNQLVSIAEQLKSDLTRPATHKYIAHQIAILYQCLSVAGPPVERHRQAVESKFPEIKSCTNASAGGKMELPEEMVKWLHNMLVDVISEVEKLPMVYRAPLKPLVQYMHLQSQEY